MEIGGKTIEVVKEKPGIQKRPQYPMAMFPMTRLASFDTRLKLNKRRQLAVDANPGTIKMELDGDYMIMTPFLCESFGEKT